MKAVVFNKFPENLAAQLRKHLEDDYGIEVLFFGMPNLEMQNPGCDVILTFYEVMSHAQAEIGTKLGKKWGVRNILLMRKTSTWSRQLPPLVRKAAANDVVSAPAPSKAVYPELTVVREPPPPPAMEVPAVEEPPSSSFTERDEVWNEVSAMFEVEIIDLKKKLAEATTEAAKSEAKYTEVSKSLTREMKRCGEAENQLKAVKLSCQSLTKERERLENELQKRDDESEQLDKALASVKKELEDERAKKTGGLAPAFSAVQTLYEAGAMDEEAAGKMLVNLLLKKK